MDLAVDIVSSEWANTSFLKREYFFRNSGDLMAYIKVHLPKNAPWVAYVIDTTSSRAFGLFAKSLQDFYKDNGYNPSREVPSGIGMVCLEKVLLDLRSLPQNIWLVIMMTLEKNRRIFEERIFTHFAIPPDYIQGLNWWWESSVATITLK